MRRVLTVVGLLLLAEGPAQARLQKRKETADPKSLVAWLHPSWNPDTRLTKEPHPTVRGATLGVEIADEKPFRAFKAKYQALLARRFAVKGGQAAAPDACEVALFKKGKGGDWDLVARGEVPTCTKLDLGPFTYEEKTALLGVRARSQQGGQLSERLYLLLREGKSLRAIFDALLYSCPEQACPDGLPTEVVSVPEASGPYEVLVRLPHGDGADRGTQPDAPRERRWSWQGDRYLERAR